MTNNKRITNLTTFLNFVVATIKLVSGLVFNFSSLLADALHSYSDFITDIISAFATKIGNKRANKKHPFGYGMIENLSNLLIGIILFLLATFILIESFNAKEVILQPIVFLVLIISIILKLVIVLLLYNLGKREKNNQFIVAAKESSTDLVSSIVVFIVSILLLFKDKFPMFKYSNMVGSIFISIIIYRIAINIIKDNIDYLLGRNEDNKEIIDAIRIVILKYKKIGEYNIKLMKIGNYYNLYLTIGLDADTTLKQLFSLEKKLKKEIRNMKFKIKFVEIEACEYKKK